MKRLALVLFALLVPASAFAYPTGLFYWPVANDNASVCAYVDDNGKDWTCGANFYAGHKGTDIAVGAGTDVLAGAGGTVNERNDGCPYGHVGDYCGGGFGNHVSLWHGGGVETIYGHFTSGSGVLGLNANASCGQRLGGSGSSGNSSGPHMHFEVRLNVTQSSYYSGYADDPYAGNCSGSLSYWASQRTGYSSGCGATTQDPSSATHCGCPSGTYPIWTCNSGGTARQRCANGSVETESCPYGCQSNPTGTDDTCKGGSACPAGTYPIWTCNSGGTARVRCTNGQVETEQCAAGCQQNAVGTDDVCKSGCPSGTYPIWTCNSGGTARVRCNNGQVETEQCPSGCQVNPTGTDDVCKTGGCPSGTYAVWTCNSGNTARVRCNNGQVETENCAHGCTGMPTGTDDVCACESGVYSVWTCNSNNTARVRCDSSGTTQTEQCPGGCTAMPTGTDDVCNAKPPPACPSGTYATWTCDAGGNSRTRCVNGTVQTEACPGGCQDNGTGNDDTCATPTSCPAGTYAIWTCSADGSKRVRCTSGTVEEDACRYGCTAMPVGVDDVCAAPSCGSAGSEIWTCNGAKTERSRCVNGQAVTESCANGCQENPSGTDDSCAPPASCPSSLTSTWICTPTGSARQRCSTDQHVEQEECPSGCDQPLSGDATCRAPPACPMGSTAAWACQKDNKGRTRCVDGRIQVEACAGGCEPNSGGDASCAAPCDASSPSTWACSADEASRTRCVNGKRETEPCMAGCDASGTEAVCAGGDGSCPVGTFARWTCDADGKQRTRCVEGQVSHEACASGCVTATADKDDVCKDTGSGGDLPSGACGCSASGGREALTALFALLALRRRRRPA